MKTELKGFMKIFRFTFQQQTRRKGWLVSTILVAVLCFAVPFGVLSALSWFGQDDGVPQAQEPEGKPQIQETEALSEVDLTALESLYMVNLTGRNEFGTEAASEALNDELAGVNFVDYRDQLERAAADSRGTEHTLVLVAEEKDDAYVLNLLLPEESGLPDGVADQVAGFLEAYGDQVTAQIHGMDSASGGGQGAVDGIPEDEAEPSAEDSDPLAGIREVIGFVIPYLNIMVLYFFVLFYGQGVAQSVITEKTSKLMEFFLISVKPAAMILGKLTAVCFCGIIQLGGWIVCLLLGFVCGGMSAVAIDRGAEDMAVLQLMDTFGEAAGGMFSVSGIVLMLLMMVAGVFLYCSLAAVGGALAGKPEDLSSTNAAFTMVLIISFFACLAGGGLQGLEGGSGWLDWIPFTAIMVTPARILLGSVSLVKGTASLLLVIVTTLAITALAGRLYRMMVLYKGDVPGVKKILQMIRAK